MATTREMCAQRSAKRCTSWLRLSHAPRTAIALVSSVLIWASPAFAQDSDLDGLSDADEIGVHGTNPALPDTDADGVGDYDEAIRFATDPLDDDSDDDGLLDGEESLTASGFALPVPIGLPAFPDAAGDVDGDGDLDLFTSYPWGGVYWVETLSGPPWASFGASSTLLDDPASRYGCSPAILVDADEDGDLDVVRSETISVAAPVYVAPALRTSENRLDEPSADFAAATHFTDVEVGHDVRFVDLDGDGRVDLWNHGKCGVDLDTTSWNARLAGAPGPFYFAENAPLAPVIDAFQYPAAKVFADFDGDGDPDLVWGGTSGPHPAVW